MSKRKFFGCIGNPPYHEETEGTSDTPTYDTFMDAAYNISDRVMLITPGRFLFNAGKTPKKWNDKMLNDEHLKVIEYDRDSSKVFPGTDIKGGVTITYHDKTKTFKPINVFTPFPELNSIFNRVYDKLDKPLSSIMYSSGTYQFTQTMHDEHPEILTMTMTSGNRTVSLISKGHETDLTSNIFDKLADIVFFNTKPCDDHEYSQIIGRHNGERASMWIDSRYVTGPDNFAKWKVLLPKANGSGALGEVLSTPLIGQPLIGHTQTFMSIGCFDTEDEAQACMKYIKTKFARTMLGVLKVTQDNPAPKWRFVPIQDFTSNSDIDWSQSVTDIDKQLYAKYGLDEDEINFIEEKVKAMP